MHLETIPFISEIAEPPAVKKARMSAPSATPTASTPTIHTAAEVAAMSARQYMDELIVPTLLRALASVNKEVRRSCIQHSSPTEIWLFRSVEFLSYHSFIHLGFDL